MRARIVDVSFAAGIALTCHVAIWAIAIYVGILVALLPFVASYLLLSLDRQGHQND